MNIILAEPGELREDKIVLTDHRAKHIVKVLGSREGDTIKFGIIGGKRGAGVIRSMQRKYPFKVELQLNLTLPPAKKPAIDLLLALPRPIMLRRILSQAAALGVGSLMITHANRVEKSFWEAGLLDSISYREHLVHGLEQAVDTRVPTVEFHRRFKPFVEDSLSEITEKYSHLLLAHPECEANLKDVLSCKPARVLLAVGPEGGWVDYEVEKLKEAGFSAFSMGERILKVDTAVVSLHGRISAVREYLS